MQAQRKTEVIVLGYRIDHVRTAAAKASHENANCIGFNRTDLGNRSDWREVLCPVSGEVLATFSSRADAERYIVDRELASARRAVSRNAA